MLCLSHEYFTSRIGCKKLNTCATLKIKLALLFSLYMHKFVKLEPSSPSVDLLVEILLLPFLFDTLV